MSDNLVGHIIHSLSCSCKKKYSIEQADDGYHLYWAKCDHLSGYDLMTISKTRREDLLQWMVDAMNARLENSKIHATGE